MKKPMSWLKASVALAIAFGITSPTTAQISVVSTTGYTVNISVIPVAILASSTDCEWGYNYNLRLNYSITLTGSNVPASLYTLQGTIGCSSGGSHFYDLPNEGGSGNVISGSNVWRGVGDCNSASSGSLGCNTANIQIEGPGISSRTITYTVSVSTLPISWELFTVAKQGSQAVLNWSTLTEVNSHFFTPERSSDGQNWQSLGTIDAAGNSSSRVSYQWIDRTPLSTNAYYRIKQTDLDAKASYSAIKAFTQNNQPGIRLYPVPATGNTVFIDGINSFHHELSIVNQLGIQVYQTKIYSGQLQLPSLTAGMYVARIRDINTGDVSEHRYLKL